MWLQTGLLVLLSVLPGTALGGTPCGDVDRSGEVTPADVAAYRTFLADPASDVTEIAPVCNVILPQRPCDILDVVVLRRDLEADLGPHIESVCRSSGCVDDSFEENDTAPEASPVGPWTVENDLNACAGDDDHFGFDIPAGNGVAIDLDFIHAYGNLDLVLFLENTVPVASASSTSDDETIVFTAPPGGSGAYSVRVFGLAGAENAYDLRICAPDALENDNATPTEVGAEFDVGGLTLCPDGSDVDLFSVIAAPGDTLVASARFSHAIGDVALSLSDPGSALVASSDSSTDDEVVQYEVTQGGDYTVTVAGQSNVYDFHLAVTPQGTCVDDGYENNDDPASAISIATPFVRTGLRVCATDPDFLSFPAGAGQEVVVDLAFSHAEGDVDVKLLDPNGIAVDFSLTSTDDERIRYLVPPGAAGTYLAEIEGFDGAENSYDIQIAVARPDCTDDLFEENDELAAASAVSLPFDDASLSLCRFEEDYYAFEAFEDDVVVVRVGFAQASGDLDLDLLDPSGSRVARSDSTTDGEEIVYPLPVGQGGVYTARIHGFEEAQNQYRLEISATPDP